MWSQSVHFPDRRSCPLITTGGAGGRNQCPACFCQKTCSSMIFTWPSLTLWAHIVMVLSPPQLSTDTTTQQHPLSVFPELNFISHLFLFCPSTMSDHSDAWIPISDGELRWERCPCPCPCPRWDSLHEGNPHWHPRQGSFLNAPTPIRAGLTCSHPMVIGPLKHLWKPEDHTRCSRIMKLKVWLCFGSGSHTCWWGRQFFLNF